MKAVENIVISLNSTNESGLKLWVDSCRSDSLFDAGTEAAENNEARFQLVEGCYYDYQLSDSGFILGDVGENIVQQHKRTTHLGTISTNIFVGRLSIPVIKRETLEEYCKVHFEVQSVKTEYREDYRDMLEFITEKCTDLLLRINSPVIQYFNVDYSSNSRALYQKFSFIKSILANDDFTGAVHRIVTAPVTKWTQITQQKDIRSAGRFLNASVKEILKSGKRTALHAEHYLRNFGVDTLPEKVKSVRKTDSVDTAENRFIKYALEHFLKFCVDINSRAVEFNHLKMRDESRLLIRQLEGHLHHTVFRDISQPTTLKLNSPVLQRKEGYREILRVWLMFDLAAKLTWTGGDDVYSGGKKDIAMLYEYWLFFRLLDLFQSIFEIEPEGLSKLIIETSDGLNLQIKQGKFTALQGIYNAGSRKLQIRFHYNRSFSGQKKYPESGSWTTTLRQDYTLSFWPNGISEYEAEKQELLVHIHFDGKYKVANLNDFLSQNEDINSDDEKIQNRKGIYKNADLLKMHAYKDAIRRTGGAYVLYPGDKSVNQKGFHEIIPGLGAFPVKPSKSNDGIGELKAFILEVIDHFLNRASQREKFAYRTYDIYKNSPGSDDFVREPLPEPYNLNRDLIPDETFVLVGYYNSQEQRKWISRSKLFNFRMGTGVGSITLDKDTVSSRYLLLHTSGDSNSGDLWKILGKGPRVFSRDDLLRNGYPYTPSKDYYLVIDIEPISDSEFENIRWDFKGLKNYSKGRASALPFTTSLSELMRNKIK